MQSLERESEWSPKSAFANAMARSALGGTDLPLQNRGEVEIVVVAVVRGEVSGGNRENLTIPRRPIGEIETIKVERKRKMAAA